MAHTLSFLAFTLFFILFASSPPAIAEPAQYSVQSYGAKPDGTTDSTKAFLSAWDQVCGSTAPASLYVPSGKFSLGKATFQGPCKNSAIVVTIDGTLVAPSDYSSIGDENNWIIFEDVDGVTVSGGILDGQGTGLWSCKASGKSCPEGVTSLEFSNSNNIEINGLASQDSQKFHIVINSCQNVIVQNVKVSAASNSQTPMVFTLNHHRVTILNSKIGTGDDCVSVGPGTANLWVENVACGPGHGISIGSLGKKLEEDGVQNVTVKTTTFTGTEMESGVKISDVTYQDIHGSSATEVGMKLDCSTKYPCTGLNWRM
ncbi:hypothetical protein GH714_030976 [Hevea brasiliensis]|uniref:Uncharacterized protein n=1 Tax=Hevea brasiliensis TaxID=3981 RepID=A0A6A6NK28_HEVBR|nr:hypothetical protein GH714_030976 [Hevea brasiliensis]